MGPITLEVVTPRGLAVHATGLDEIVVRRRERGRALGSEVAILPRHGPLLATLCAHELRYRQGESTCRVAVGQGVVEVIDDSVTVLVSSAGPPA